MKIRLHYNVWFLRKSWVNGITLYPFILFKQDKKDVSDRLFRHELEHIYQVREMGWFKFYISYLWIGLRHKHKTHPYEEQARERQHDPLTEEEQELRA